ncbi:hypothetical protein AAIR98_001439 [Elusimicrobium simillimum]|uniref:hypothetical protein n=1 Tax=Elusimicrobium simillimum TaxID=3143438 RepID=UPI003C6F60BB
MSDKKKEKQKLSDRQIKRNKDDWAKVLSMPEGRRVIYSILLNCNEDVNTFDPANPYNTAYQNGKKDVGEIIKKKIKNSKREAIFQMEDEYKSDVKETQEQINQINKERED